MSNEQGEKIKKQTERIRELERENDRISRDLNNQINQWQFEYGRAKELEAQLQEAQNKIMWLEKDLADTKTRCEELTAQLQTASEAWDEAINSAEQNSTVVYSMGGSPYVEFQRDKIEKDKAAYIGQSVNTLTEETFDNFLQININSYKKELSETTNRVHRKELEQLIYDWERIQKAYKYEKDTLTEEQIKWAKENLNKEPEHKSVLTPEEEFLRMNTPIGNTLTEDKSRNLNRANTNAGVNDNKGAGRLENQTNK